MLSFPVAAESLAAIPNLTVTPGASLSSFTRFGLGGPASLFCDASDARSFVAALHLVRASGIAHIVIGGGSNLIVSDAGFDGVVLRFTGSVIERRGISLRVEAGAVLQDVVDQSIAFGMRGLETMTGIPGFLGAAIYGNAGAYGHSIQERVEAVRFTDGDSHFEFNNAECRFHYRESVFKDRKDWIILSADLQFAEGDAVELAGKANAIRAIRDEKYPPAMKCAGSIFKNLLFAELPPTVQAEVPTNAVREGKVPSAWFLEQVGAKGLHRGDIQVAAYHANLIYNQGAGTAEDLVALISELKQRVRDRFAFELEEEVQYVGFDFAEVSISGTRGHGR